MRNFTILSLIGLLAASIACGGDSDGAIVFTSAPGGTESGSPGPRASQYVEHLESQLPADFPKSFPIYPGVEIARGDTIDRRFAIDLRSADEMDVVIEFYRNELATEPWRIVSEDPSEGSVILEFSSDDDVYKGEIAIGMLGERTWILVAMGRPE